jgi:hypothetical protein
MEGLVRAEGLVLVERPVGTLPKTTATEGPGSKVSTAHSELDRV